MEWSEKIGALAGALAKAQGSIKGAAKDSENPFFKSKYADLASIMEACRKPLSENGLAILQFPKVVEEGVEVKTILAHESGEWVSEILCLPVSKHDAQGVGSAITYARRYGLSAMVGVAPEDDDGNAAAVSANSMARKQSQKVAPKPEPVKPQSEKYTKENMHETVKAMDSYLEELGCEPGAVSIYTDVICEKLGYKGDFATFTQHQINALVQELKVYIAKKRAEKKEAEQMTTIAGMAEVEA